MTYNITWGLLHGAANTGEPWVRGSGCTPGFHGRDAKVRALFPDLDPSIRGWLVETFVQAALLSSWRKELLDLDGLNTYFDPLEGPVLRLYPSRKGVFVEHPTAEPGDIFMRSVRYAINGQGPYSVSYTRSDGMSDTVTLEENGGKMLLPFYDGTITLRNAASAKENGEFQVTLARLPYYLPEDKLMERLGTKNLPEAAGAFCTELLRGLK